MPDDLHRRALLLDLDGVLRIWKPDNAARAEALAGLPAGAVHRAASTPDLLQPALTGRISDDMWRRQIAERLRADYPAADAEGAIAMWAAYPGEVDAVVLSLIRARRPGVDLVLVTNATTRLDADLARLGLNTEFDQIVNSAAVGHAKPSREIFDHALASVAVAASEAFFVDDNAGNVAGAKQLGIAGHVYQGVSQLRTELVLRGYII